MWYQSWNSVCFPHHCLSSPASCRFYFLKGIGSTIVDLPIESQFLQPFKIEVLRSPNPTSRELPLPSLLWLISSHDEPFLLS